MGTRKRRTLYSSPVPRLASPSRAAARGSGPTGPPFVPRAVRALRGDCGRTSGSAIVIRQSGSSLRARLVPARDMNVRCVPGPGARRYTVSRTRASARSRSPRLVSPSAATGDALLRRQEAARGVPQRRYYVRPTVDEPAGKLHRRGGPQDPPLRPGGTVVLQPPVATDGPCWAADESSAASRRPGRPRFPAERRACAQRRLGMVAGTIGAWLPRRRGRSRPRTRAAGRRRGRRPALRRRRAVSVRLGFLTWPGRRPAAPWLDRFRSAGIPPGTGRRSQGRHLRALAHWPASSRSTRRRSSYGPNARGWRTAGDCRDGELGSCRSGSGRR